MRHRAGFTLIELSIVLVIIGLIAGGVLVGRDLIEAAEIRATISQIERYNTAVNTFHSKYNCLPGDCPEAEALQLGFYAMTSPGETGVAPGGPGYGDGNGVIEDCVAGPLGNQNSPVCGETVAIWRHLSDANLIDGSFGANLPANGNLNISANPPPSPDQYLPTAKIGGCSIIAGSANGLNYWAIAGVPSDYTIAFPCLTPIEAYDIDVKIDDGMPNTGQIQARRANIGLSQYTSPLADSYTTGMYSGWNTPSYLYPWSTPSPAGYCITGGPDYDSLDPADTYAVAGGYGNTPACALRLKWN